MKNQFQKIHPPIELLDIICQKFVVDEFKDRFVMESLKKREKLLYRIGHNMESVFNNLPNRSEIYKKIKPDTLCWMLNGSWHYETWETCASKIKKSAGFVIFSEDGNFIYAESED